MPTESELRSLLHGGGPIAGVQPPGIDTASVIRRSRRRRMTKQIAIGGTATLAAAGIGIAGFTGIQGAPADRSTSVLSEPQPGDAESSGAADSGAGVDGGNIAGDETSTRAPDYTVDLCGASPTEVTPSVVGLELTTRFPARAATGARVDGSVVLTNRGPDRVTGSTGAVPAVTLSQADTVLWHTTGPQVAMAVLVDLDPGESMEYPASFLPVACSPDEESTEEGAEEENTGSFGTDLPRLPAGEYRVSALIDVVLDDGPGDSSNDYPAVDLVTGPAASITLE